MLAGLLTRERPITRIFSRRSMLASETWTRCQPSRGSCARFFVCSRIPRQRLTNSNLCSPPNPVIVQKIRQVVASLTFAGQANGTEFTLKDAIVRLGLKEVGSIAMQVMVVNSFVEASGTLFDFKRFWGHSVGCALAADKIYKSKQVQFAGELAFQDYWLGGLLHDIGKLVLGVFFWDHFSRVLGESRASPSAKPSASSETQSITRTSAGWCS